MDNGGAWAGIGGVAGAILTGLGAWLLSYLSQRHQQSREDRREALDETYRLLDVQRRDISRLEQKVAQQSADHQQCLIRYARAESRIEHLEEALTKANIPFRPWVKDDSATHAILPPEAHP